MMHLSSKTFIKRVNRMAKKYPKLGSIIKRLLFERDIKSIDLARAVNLPPPTIHRLITGKSTRPYLSSLKPIADYFAINVAQLLGEESLPSDLSANNDKTILRDNEKTIITKISLIPWNNLKYWEKKDNNIEIPFVGSISKLGFSTIMPDSSMEPIIQKNSIVIFDPSLKPIDRSYVLVKLHEINAYVLRQLLIDAEHRYLKSLNPDLNTFKMRLLDQNDDVIACLVETRQNFQPENNSATSQELTT